jgi:proteasome beta subunit
MEQADHQKAVKTGTTTVGLICKDAVVLVADQKATMGYLIASRKIRKVHPVEKHIAMTAAGMVGDMDFLIRLMKAELKIYRLTHKPISVRAAAALLANILYQGKGYFPYWVQILLGGYDSAGAKLYSLDAGGGEIEEKDFFSTGSGSPVALGVLEDSYRENLSSEEGIKVGIRAVKAATRRDAASGGENLTVAVIDKNGYREVPSDEVRKLAGQIGS